jgi:hypothetical protein
MWVDFGREFLLRILAVGFGLAPRTRRVMVDMQLEIAIPFLPMCSHGN